MHIANGACQRFLFLGDFDEFVLADGRVPDANHFVTPTGGECFAIGRECHGQYWPCVADERGILLSIREIPELDRAIA